jgi:hypothetical protein
MASFVANELIIYPAGIRFVFFMFTLFICLTTTWLTYAMTGFYFLKWVYQKYVNRDKPNPPIRLMPKIFGMLPLVVENPNDGTFMKTIKSPFTYLKEADAAKKNELNEKTEETMLQEMMAAYKASLTQSFPYYESAKKSNQIFNTREEQLEEYFDTVHKRPELKKEPVASQNTPVPLTIQANQQNAFLREVQQKQNMSRQFLASPAPALAPPAPPVPPVLPEAPLVPPAPPLPPTLEQPK